MAEGFHSDRDIAKQFKKFQNCIIKVKIKGNCWGLESVSSASEARCSTHCAMGTIRISQKGQ